ncbi:sugar-binding domain-containing protein [Propionimicrobium sp. PCR01-08-3]|uniref:sugar-binding transcriptional regulator n=1 Tax=Propionimicrobium sp. PCR01-08-3 TaxID=3052086 RepID=UPI00255C3EDD|nr:sugar-binding domain-containing protein [Propionimicrobium sp. PCR01-08-3]WIY83957.1 sugar-binding domain-containing protein [Propionimicrobium sp. PCR01-08-3]
MLIVHITISNPDEDYSALTEQLRVHLGLAAVQLVPPNSDTVAERNTLGEAGAKALSRQIHEGSNVGFSWGRTLMAIASHVDTLPDAQFIQITGVIGNDASQSPIAILGQIAQHSNSVGKALIAPLFCSSPDVARAQRAEPSVAEVLALYDEIDLAFLSVGAWDTRVTQLEEHLSAADARLLDRAGAVADSNGLFFDADGRYLDIPLNDCRISISVEQLAAIPSVVAVAGTLAKVNAIYAICRSGVPTCLITTTEVAQALLELPAITERVYR